MITTSARFLVAKYTPDLQRMEPRNIGVVVWSEGGFVAARFLGETKEGRVRPPAIVDANSRHAYRQWVEYWRYQLSGKGLTNREGSFITRASPQFLAGLMQKSKEQFRLVDGGALLENIQPYAIDEFVEELFQKLVEREPTGRASAESHELIKACKVILKSSGIADRPDYMSALPVPRYVHGVLRPFTVDYAIGEVSRPSAVFQKVLLARHQSIDSSILMFDALANDPARPVSRDNCVAIVNARKNVSISDDALSGIEVLRKLSTLVDINDPDAVATLNDVSSRVVVKS